MHNRGSLLAILFIAVATVATGFAQVNDKSDMHPIIQLDFGPFGSHLPGDGQDYCYPTTASMLVFWLQEHGFTQLAPAFSDANALNLDRVLGGLMQTSPTGGTYNSAYISGLSDYLNAKGISDSLITWDSSGNPSLDWLNSHNGDNSVVIAGLSWFYYDSSAGVYLQDGGHGTALVAANSAASTLTVNNPYPSTFYNVPNILASDPETVDISVRSGTGLMTTNSNGDIVQYEDADKDYIQVITPILGPGNPGGLAVYDTGIALTLADAAKPSDGSYSISTWTITGTKTLNTNGGNLTVIAPLAGTGGIDKEGDGELQLQNTNTLTGDNTVTAGTLSSTTKSGTPFGTGNITLIAGTLKLIPDDATPADVSLSIASGSNNSLTVDGGGANLSLDRGANTGLDVTIGGYTSGSQQNISLQNQGTLTIASASGVSELGNLVNVHVAGAAGNQPSITNGMVTPNLVGQDNDGNHSGAFLTYDATDGFKAATTTGGDINSASSTAIYKTSSAQTVTSSATVYALEVDNATIGGDGSSNLSVGSQGSGDYSGVILNGGTISTATFSYGASNAYVYANLSGGTISSAISSSGDFVKFGEGVLTLSGNSSATQTGNIYVNSGMLHVATGGVTGSGAVEVRNGANLKVSGTVGGAVTVKANATTVMDAGTIQGGITVAALGTLQGGGMINGSSSILGVVSAGSQIGTLTFGGATEFQNGSQFYMTLASLVDNNTGTAGTDWNALSFLDSVNFGNSDAESADELTMYLDLDASIDPNSGNSFWTTGHDWTFATASLTDAFLDADFSVENWSWLSGTFSWHYGDSKTKLTLEFTPVAVPEPGSVVLLLAGVGIIAFISHRKVVGSVCK
ncbi:MAG: PEP-CTERM sorting domain-containing protein [Chthoniobacterales bacterium]